MDQREYWDDVARKHGYDYWDWGSAADWVSGLGTMLALCATLVLFAADRHARRRSQANGLLVWQTAPLGPDTSDPNSIDHATFLLNNTSSQPFRYVHLVPLNGKWLLDRRRRANSLAELDKQLVRAEFEQKRRFSVPFDPSKVNFIAVIQDANGRIWYRKVDKQHFLTGAGYRTRVALAILKHWLTPSNT